MYYDHYAYLDPIPKIFAEYDDICREDELKGVRDGDYLIEASRIIPLIQKIMDKFELLRQEFKEEIERLKELEKESANIGDYANALRRHSEREAMCRAWTMVNNILN